MPTRLHPLVLVLALATIVLMAAPPAAGEEMAIPGCNLSRAAGQQSPTYAQVAPLVWSDRPNGLLQWTVELQGGSSYLHILYASDGPRPCRLSVNERQYPGQVLAKPTGGLTAKDLRWESLGPLAFDSGINVIGIQVSGRATPHVAGLYISGQKTPPERTVFEQRDSGPTALVKQLNLPGLRRAITHLSETYPDRYACGETYLKRLDAIEQQLERCLRQEPAPAGTLGQLADQVETLRREALVTNNPLVQFGKILFIKRHTYQSSHYYTDFIDGCKYFGGNLCILALGDGKVSELVPDMSGGIFGRFDLSFDGQRVLFDYKARKDVGFRIYEVGIDGRDLRQLTFEPPDEAQRMAKYWHQRKMVYPGLAHDPYTADLYWYKHYTDDMQPCYLPDGGIAFISTRCERGILCDHADFFATTALYRMDGDGGNLQLLSQTPVSETSPSVANDGRLLYTRWEYVDKGSVGVKSLWAMHPDGSRTVEVFTTGRARPPTLLFGRAVPGSNNQYVALGTSHWAVTGVGTIVRVDIDQPVRTPGRMTYVTPEIDMFRDEGFHHKIGGQWVRDDKGPLFSDPYPLSAKFFLVSYNPDREWKDPTAYGLYLLDEYGNRVLLYRDPAISCWHPVPLAPRPKPPVLPSAPRGSGDTATLVLSDVYAGLDGVPPGAIKYLRIMETVPRPWAARHSWSGDTDGTIQHVAISKNTHIHIKLLHGIVPVEEDGSAHFTVPADKNLFLQALDENFMEVQRMRTFVNLRPGETRSCIGCHEPRRLAPPNKGILALRHAPAVPAPQPGETAPRPIYYATDVQPLLDKHCVRCHCPSRRDGNLDLSGELTTLFNRSYENILARGDLLKVIPEIAGLQNVAPVPPKTYGSHASKLIALVRNGHEDVKLSQEEFIKLVTWVDANAPYYGSYFGRRNLRYRNHPDFRPVPTVASASGVPPAVP